MNHRVWHLCSNRWNSAITEYALRSAQSLKRVGWQSILSAKPGSPCESRAEALGLRGKSFAFRWKDLKELRSEAEAIKPDVILTYGGPETFLARFLGVPVIRFRGQDSDLSESLKPFSLRLNLGFCRAILTPAEVVRKRFVKALPNKAIGAVTLGLDSDVFHHSSQKAERPTLLMVGRLDPIKGHREFMSLFAECLKDPSFQSLYPRLHIVGLSSNLKAEELRSFGSRLGLRDGDDFQVFDERVENLPSLMAAATLGIVPSIGSEVIGRVSEEFLLCGAPILVSDVGSLKELLRDESFGSVLSADTLKSWLRRAWHEEESLRMQRAAMAKAHYSLESMGRNLEQFLVSVLK